MDKSIFQSRLVEEDFELIRESAVNSQTPNVLGEILPCVLPLIWFMYFLVFVVAGDVTGDITLYPFFFANYEDLFRATNWTFIVNYHFLDKVSLYKVSKDAIPYQYFCNTFYIWIESILDGPFSIGEIKQ
ncbi:hypothetical protein KV679_14560 [Bacillus sp. JRC01]|nr:hypothetical protein [Bacillus sp. JRC01]